MIYLILVPGSWMLVSGYVVQVAGCKVEAKGRERRVKPNCIRLKIDLPESAKK